MVGIQTDDALQYKACLGLVKTKGMQVEIDASLLDRLQIDEGADLLVTMI